METTPNGADALGRVRDALFDTSLYAGELAKSVEQLEALYARLYPEAYIPITEHFYVPTVLNTTNLDNPRGHGCTLHPRWTDHAPASEHRPRRSAIDATLALRAAIDSAIEAVAGVAACMDSDAQSVDQRWTTRTINHLRKLRGAILLGHGDDVFPSALPMIRAGVPDALRDDERHVMARMEEVKSALAAGVGRQTPQSTSTTTDILPSTTTVEAARPALAAPSGAGNAKTPALTATAVLTADHESILAVLGKTPTKCMTVIDVSSAGTIRDRETVGRLLGELAVIGMVNRPHGRRKGYALTDSGRNRLSGASPT